PAVLERVAHHRAGARAPAVGGPHRGRGDVHQPRRHHPALPACLPGAGGLQAPLGVGGGPGAGVRIPLDAPQRPGRVPRVGATGGRAGELRRGRRGTAAQDHARAQPACHRRRRTAARVPRVRPAAGEGDLTMKAFTVLVAIGVIIGAIFGMSALAYVLGGFLEQRNLAWVSNLLILLLGFVMIIATFLTLAERKWSALMQDRIGPTRATINLPGLRGRPLGGVFHVATDAIKMLTKEDFRPKIADPLLFSLGPILAFAPVLALFAIVPVGPVVNV